MARTQLGDYRAGRKEPRINALADLVSSASRLLGRRVKASELYDLGEDTPVATPRHRRRRRYVPKTYATRFDRLLVRLDVPQNSLARESGISRQGLRRFRMNRTNPLVSSIRRIVIALRRMGHPVKASDVAPIGEE